MGQIQALDPVRDNRQFRAFGRIVYGNFWTGREKLDLVCRFIRYFVRDSGRVLLIF